MKIADHQLQSLQCIFALNVSRLIDYIYANQYKCSIGEALRSPLKAASYTTDGVGVVSSLHCKRLAIDICLFSADGKSLTNPEDLDPFGVFWESLHPQNSWGGRFRHADVNHFEMRDVA